VPWVRLDDKFHGNPKTLAVGNAGAGLYVRALSYCADQLTDGWVPAGWAREAGGRVLPQKLLAASLWIAVTGGEHYEYELEEGFYKPEIPSAGFFIPDYLLMNPSKATVEQKRSDLHQKRSEAGRRGAASRWQNDGKRDSKSMAKGMTPAWQADGPVPIPLSNPSAVRKGPKEQHPDLSTGKADAA
jgi:hypothetical protein